MYRITATTEDGEIKEWSLSKDSGDANILRAVAAEITGVALLLFLGCLPTVLGTPVSPVGAALGVGALITLLVQSFDHVSGALFSPAVTLAAAIRGRVAPERAGILALAQCAGAVLGTAALMLVATKRENMCLTLPHPALSPFQAAFIEAIATAALVFPCCANWDLKQDAWPVKIGTTLTALCLLVGPLTGASMNPARTLGTALCANHWQNLWICPLEHDLNAPLTEWFLNIT